MKWGGGQISLPISKSQPQLLGQWLQEECWDHKGETKIQQPNIGSPVHIDVLQFSPGLLALTGTAEYARHRQHLRGSPYTHCMTTQLSPCGKLNYGTTTKKYQTKQNSSFVPQSHSLNDHSCLCRLAKVLKHVRILNTLSYKMWALNVIKSSFLRQSRLDCFRDVLYEKMPRLV